MSEKHSKLIGKITNFGEMYCGFEFRLFTKIVLVLVLVRDFPSWSWTLAWASAFRRQ